ncbi:MAG: hypothetical protein Q4D14_01725 [Bacteroidales bacterium]|nr:hypothetical protein [Bacteroidales bacterium]
MQQTVSQKLARIASAVLQPIFVPLYAILLWWTVVPAELGWSYRLYSATPMFFFAFLFPGTVHLWYYATGRVSDFFISNKKERRPIYIISMVSILFCCLQLHLFHIWPLSTFMLYSLVALCIVSLINRRWKISAHMAAWGCLVGGVFAFQYATYRLNLELLILLVLLSGVLGWARIETHSHTLSQVISGFLLGVGSATIALLITLY